MAKKIQVISFFLSPYVISLIVTVGILLVLPNYFEKHKLTESVESHFIAPGSYCHYEDLDNDGLSEMILTRENSQGNASYEIVKSNGDFVDQFNLNTKFGVYKRAWFEDVNGNRIKEIFILTQSRDSVFLNVQEHIILGKPITKKIFVDRINSHNGKFELRAGRRRKMDGINYDNDTIHFFIATGYAGNPRSIYFYDATSCQVKKSPHLTNPPSIYDLIDLDNDGKKELLVSNGASQNKLDSSYQTQSDYSTWLTILNEDLEFLFEPIEFQAKGSIFQTALRHKNTKFIYALFASLEYEKIPSKLLKIDSEGKILKYISLPKSQYQHLVSYNDQSIILYNYSRGKYQVYNLELEKVKEFDIAVSTAWNYHFDVNNNGQKEWLLYDIGSRKLHVFEEDFSHPVTLELPAMPNEIPIEIGTRFSNLGNQIYLQLGSNLVLINYFRNPYYNLRVLFYLGIYLMILTITLLIAKGQQLKEDKKHAIERKISGLHLKTITNKIDSHFVFNAMNVISEMILTGKKLEADEFIWKYSQFMRATLENSDKMETTLEEELNYVNNFIELQRIRFNNSFDYQINISDAVNIFEKVPKHILFAYVENAIKHGLANKQDGILKVEIFKDQNSTHINIIDNGKGFRRLPQSLEKGTGTGLKIMSELFKLYEGRFNISIKQSIREFYTGNQVNGVEVRLVLRPKK